MAFLHDMRFRAYFYQVVAIGFVALVGWTLFSTASANLAKQNIATGFELGGAIMLWIGLGTRLFAFVLLFLTFVATAAVHWPSMISMWSDLAKGYAITDMGHGNFKLPLLFVVMLLPLIFGGAGRFSLDRLLARRFGAGETRLIHGATTWALALAVFGIPFLMLIPAFGAALLVAAVALALLGRRGAATLQTGPQRQFLPR